jgi:predicted MPP superfamily phosphohydrolase
MELLLKRIVFCIIVFLNIVASIVFVSYIISLFKIDVSKYEVESKKIPKEFDGFKILQLSDLHNRKFNRGNKKLVKKIQNQNPDIIVITGDMVSSNSKGFNGFFDVIKGLDNKYPIYYIFGNHEQRLPIEKQTLIVEKLKEYGVKVINNSSEFIRKDNEYMQIYGLQQSLVYYNNYLKNKKIYSYEEKDIENVFHKIDDSQFNILLAHNPLYFETYEKWGADLVFSGHVHGGIIRIPFVGGVLSPERTFFPKYDAGEYTINNSEMIVSRGLGYSTINFRVLNNPEICIVELKSE